MVARGYPINKHDLVYSLIYVKQVQDTHNTHYFLLIAMEVPAVAIRLLELMNVKSLVALEWQLIVY